MKFAPCPFHWVTTIRRSSLLALLVLFDTITRFRQVICFSLLQVISLLWVLTWQIRSLSQSWVSCHYVVRYLFYVIPIWSQFVWECPIRQVDYVLESFCENSRLLRISPYFRIWFFWFGCVDVQGIPHLVCVVIVISLLYINVVGVSDSKSNVPRILHKCTKWF